MRAYKYFEVYNSEAAEPRYRVVFVNPQTNRLHDVALVWSESRANWLVEILNKSKTYHSSEVEYD